MGLFSKDIQTKDDLFVHTLQDIYYAEQQIIKGLPKMIEKTSDPALQRAFKHHLEETKNHVTRLERVFQLHGAEAKGVKCEAIDGIIGEAESIMSDAGEEVRDAAILAAAQAVEHYEIARYGTLAEWATEMGHDECASILSETLGEEKAADAKLTEIAEASVNRRAA
jgi:ferritin-like metal-binding protein YciE